MHSSVILTLYHTFIIRQNAKHKVGNEKSRRFFINTKTRLFILYEE